MYVYYVRAKLEKVLSDFTSPWMFVKTISHPYVRSSKGPPPNSALMSVLNRVNTWSPQRYQIAKKGLTRDRVPFSFYTIIFCQIILVSKKDIFAPPPLIILMPGLNRVNTWSPQRYRIAEKGLTASHLRFSFHTIIIVSKMAMLLINSIVLNSSMPKFRRY